MKNNSITEKSDPFEIFNYKNLGSVRTALDEYGNPLFCLVDVCSILNIKNSSRVNERLLDPGVHTMNLGVRTGTKRDGTPSIQNLRATFIDQGNLFKILFTSRKPEAQEFANWVCYVVLPSIAKTGSYSLRENNMSEIEMIHSISGEIIKHGKEMVRINKDIENINMQILMHESTLHIHEEKIDIVTEEGFFSISTFAKIVGLPVSLETARELGIEATKLCEDRGIMVSSIPHQIFGRVHIYPYKILREIFDDYIVKCANC